MFYFYFYKLQHMGGIEEFTMLRKLHQNCVPVVVFFFKSQKKTRIFEMQWVYENSRICCYCAKLNIQWKRKILSPIQVWIIFKRLQSFSRTSNEMLPLSDYPLYLFLALKICQSWTNYWFKVLDFQYSRKLHNQPLHFDKPQGKTKISY